MSQPSYRVGVDLHLLGEHADELLLESRCRLPPGRVVHVILQTGERRRVLVTEWRLTGVGSRGPVYRGRARGLTPAREVATPDETGGPR